ncbi:MAG TPA: winged helix-turn-helix transcriptional regulator [Candidatus Methanofastidiosa archaeon]|nr:winged helix-turn-helix transcriptional regulator [Candidatus Methanofastidiosa archaeon]
MLIDALASMSNEYRIMILDSLKEGRKRPQDMEKLTGLTRGGLERHLKLLIDSHLVEKETYVEEGRAKVIYFLSNESEDFLNKLDEIYSEFHRNIVRRKSPDEYKKENIKILSLKIDKVNESLEELENLKGKNDIDEKEYLDLKVQYVNDLIRYQQELSSL